MGCPAAALAESDTLAPVRKEDFDYELPEHLIAQYPAEQRTGSRLLCLDGATGGIRHAHFPDVVACLQPGDLLVLNDTRVVPARLFGHKASGGRIEVLIDHLDGDGRVFAQIRASNPPRPGTELHLPGGATAQVVGREGRLFELDLAGLTDVLAYLEAHGHTPLPPYVRRPDTEADRTRYQTVFAERPGAVAAPTAGLHFDEALLAAVRERGVETAELTLHVGAGTFAPVESDDLDAHRMHAEWLQVPPSLVERVEAARARGGRIVAVGTTVVRALEAAASESPDGKLTPFTGETRLFIRPGFRFRVVDALITNFHLPQSTLLMLVCAFAGRRQTLAAYEEAVRSAYRFFSYGDAMFLTRAES